MGMANDERPVPLLVTLGHAGDDSFNLRFPAEYASEVTALLDEHDISHGTVLEFSAGQELWIEAARVLSIPGGLAALASIIKTIVHRHDAKRFILKRGGEVRGFRILRGESGPVAEGDGCRAGCQRC